MKIRFPFAEVVIDIDNGYTCLPSCLLQSSDLFANFLRDFQEFYVKKFVDGAYWELLGYTFQPSLPSKSRWLITSMRSKTVSFESGTIPCRSFDSVVIFQLTEVLCWFLLLFSVFVVEEFCHCHLKSRSRNTCDEEENGKRGHLQIDSHDEEISENASSGSKRRRL